MRGETLVPKIPLRGFPPRTYGSQDIEKKAEVRDKLKSNITNLEELRRRAKGKKLWVDVVFYLYEGTTVLSRTDKDVDNMSKIVLDALPEFMDQKKEHEGLGLMPGNKDDLVFELHATKVLVPSEKEEGIDVEIGEWAGR